MSNVEEIIKKYCTRIRDDRIFFAPQIPPKKLQNALADYAQGAQSERALALIDNSFFGSAKDGVLLTTKHIYSNEWSSETYSLELGQIESVRFVENEDSKEIFLNELAFATIHMADAASVKAFAAMLEEIRAMFHPSEQERAAHQPRAGKCASCGASYRVAGSASASCAYCGSHLQ
jgi:hypothetical protein